MILEKRVDTYINVYSIKYVIKSLAEDDMKVTLLNIIGEKIQVPSDYIEHQNISDNTVFGRMFDNITVDNLEKEIQEKYHVTLKTEEIKDVNTLLAVYDFRCTNYVGISKGTLNAMAENPALKKKVFAAIEEFCSPEEQKKIELLQPPVKSAGMIVYPNGNVIYWLEGYPNDDTDDNTKEKRMLIEDDYNKMLDHYDINGSQSENKDLNNEIMGILASSFKNIVNVN